METGYVDAVGKIDKTYDANQDEHSRYRGFPVYQTLIDLATKEKRVDDVLSLYQAGRIKKYNFTSRDEIAETIEDKFPNEALKIWLDLVEKSLYEAHRSAYAESIRYLHKVLSVYTRTNRLSEWYIYINKLKEENKRRPRFLKELRQVSKETLL